MEQVLPEPFTRLELEDDAILEAAAWRQMGDSIRAEKLLSEMLCQDLRCVDPHAHLGDMFFDGYWGTPHFERALTSALRQ